LARVRSVLRRTGGHCQPESPAPQAAEPEIFAFAGWTVDFTTHDLRSPDGSSCKMTAGQMKLLELFARNPNKVLSRNRIMDLLKGHDWIPSDRSVDNQVARLRRLIEKDPRHPRIIKTVHGAGYRFTADIKPAD
ncbi:MAG: winged helix-turn-helix domain-containing protein, partial [Hyphomicrobiales bacterium]|nr:winged helix-turn-helix domain-containing protein [Hyphomicrobiales bacterium]